MVKFMRQTLKWSHEVLHDAVRALGLLPPAEPSMWQYYCFVYSSDVFCVLGIVPLRRFGVHAGCSFLMALSCISFYWDMLVMRSLRACHRTADPIRRKS